MNMFDYPSISTINKSMTVHFQGQWSINDRDKTVPQSAASYYDWLFRSRKRNRKKRKRSDSTDSFRRACGSAYDYDFDFH